MDPFGPPRPYSLGVSYPSYPYPSQEEQGQEGGGLYYGGFGGNFMYQPFPVTYGTYGVQDVGYQMYASSENLQSRGDDRKQERGEEGAHEEEAPRPSPSPYGGLQYQYGQQGYAYSGPFQGYGQQYPSISLPPTGSFMYNPYQMGLGPLDPSLISSITGVADMSKGQTYASQQEPVTIPSSRDQGAGGEGGWEREGEQYMYSHGQTARNQGPGLRRGRRKLRNWCC